MIKLLVFDWDGTLADSVSKIIQCKRFLAKKYNLPVPSDETIKHVLGMKFENAISLCFPTANQDCLSKLGEDFHLLMQQNEYQADLFPQAKEILLFLKNGFKLAIATSKNKKELTTALIHHEITDIFEVVCCGNEYQSKPHPAMLNYIMEQCGVCPDETLMIGDTTTDIAFSKNAGVKVVAVTYGAHHENKLKLASPDELISGLCELPKIIEKLCYSTKMSCRL